MTVFEMSASELRAEVIRLSTERAIMEKQFKRMAKNLDRAKVNALRAHDLMIAANTRAHDMKLEYKSLKNSLAVCERDARRYQLLRKIGARVVGCPDAVLHDHAVDLVIDAAIADEGRRPSSTERMASRHPGVNHRDRVS